MVLVTAVAKTTADNLAVLPDGRQIAYPPKAKFPVESTLFLIFGKSHDRHPKSVASCLPSRPDKRALAIVTNVGRDAVDAAAQAARN
jgi:hypothetical protein